MKKVLKWLGIGIGALAALALVAFGVLFALSSQRAARTYEVTPAALTIPTDSASIAHGRHFARAIAMCIGCHGYDFSGSVFIDDPAFGRYVASNITPAGVTKNYTDADWVRAIRHGVKPNGRSVLIMPAAEYYEMGDADLAALIAYMKTISPVESELPKHRIGPIARFLIASGAAPVLSASVLDHTKPHPGAPAAGATPEYGRYLATIACIGCHGANLQGSQPPGPVGPNITPAGAIAGWTETDFRSALRAGKRPDGTVISTEMPWPITSEMTDTEIAAVWAYLQTLPRASDVASH